MTIDIYQNGVVKASDVTLGTNRYDINYIELTGWSAPDNDWYASVKIGELSDDTRSQTFGFDWIADNPLNLMALVQRPGSVMQVNPPPVLDHRTEYIEAGFNTFLAFKNWEDNYLSAMRLGLPWHSHLGVDPCDPENLVIKSNLTYNMSNFAGGTGFLVDDEPTRTEMLQIGEVVQWCKKTYPELLVYSNAYPGGVAGGPAGKYYGMPWIGPDTYEDPPVPYDYENYLDDFVRIIDPDVVKFDMYPFVRPPEGTTAEYLDLKYYRNLSILRETAQRRGKPYWMFIQSYERTGGGARWFPSESDLRMQLWTALTYGVTGISYFTYDHVFERALLEDPNFHIPTQLYYDAVIANPEVSNVGQALRYLDSTGVGMVLGQHTDPCTLLTVDNDLPVGAVEWAPGVGPGDPVPNITSISALNLGSTNDGLRGDVLVGYFFPRLAEFAGQQNEVYFMITNSLRDPCAVAADTQQTITINFDMEATGIDKLQRVRRSDGKVEFVSLVADGGSLYHLDLTLPGGTGDLFKFNTGERFIVKDPLPVPPKVTFVAPGPGMNIPFDTTVSDGYPDVYGQRSYCSGFAWDGYSGSTDGQTQGFARYYTTVANDANAVTAMPTDEDWVFELTYKHAGDYDEETVWSAKNNTLDKAMIKLVSNGTFLGGEDDWTLSMWGGNGWEAILDNVALGNTFHHFVFHYKADSQTVDAFMDDDLVTADFAFGHGEYGIEFVQIEGTRAGPDSWDHYRGIRIGQYDWPIGCGDPDHPYPDGDVNNDCIVDLEDVTLMGDHWLECTDPNCN